MFVGFSDFLHNLQLASHELATIGINVTKTKFQIPNTIKVVYNDDDAQNEEDDNDDDD